MSIEYTKRVWKNKELKKGKLMVMLALADHATRDGDSWPGMPLLMEKTRLTDRQIRRVLNDLAADGTITIEERAIGRGKRPHYILFPNDKKADILSDQQEIKADISDDKSGHFVHGKADISAQIQSYVRREPITEPLTTKRGDAPNGDPTPLAIPEPVLENPKAKPSRKRKAETPKPPKHPAVLVFHEERSLWPNKTQEAAIANAVTDLELWRLVLVKWGLRGYNPMNVDGMLDWYAHPEKFTQPNGGANGSGNGRVATNYQRPAAAEFDKAEWEAHQRLAETEQRPF